MSHVLQSATKHYQRLTGGAVGSLQHACDMKSSPVALVVVVVGAPSRVNVRLAAKGCASLTTVQPGVLLGSPSPRAGPARYCSLRASLRPPRSQGSNTCPSKLVIGAPAAAPASAFRSLATAVP